MPIERGPQRGIVFKADGSPQGAPMAPQKIPIGEKNIQSMKGLDTDARTQGEQDEVIRSMEGFTRNLMERIMQDPELKTEPSDFFPDPRLERDKWLEEMGKLRDEAGRIPDPLLVVLIGNYLTEDGLPMFTSLIDRTPAFRDRDPERDAPTVWTDWNGYWRSDEDTHGKFIYRWLENSPRVNMHQVDRTLRYYLRNGFDPKIGKSGYKTLIYTSFQEDGAGDAHKNSADLAEPDGLETLVKGLNRIVKEERRHRAMYSGNTAEIFRRDPHNALIAARELLRQGIIMPGARMDDSGAFTGDQGQSGLYKNYELVAEASGIYTVRGYRANYDRFMRDWNVAGLSVSGEAADAQEYLLDKIPRRIDRHERFMQARLREEPILHFSWLDNRPIQIGSIPR